MHIPKNTAKLFIEMKLFYKINSNIYLHPFIHLMGIYMLGNCFALLLNLPSVTFGFDIKWKEGFYLVSFGIIAIIIMFVIETIFIYFSVKPLTVTLENLQKNKNEKCDAALIRTTNLPIICVLRVAFIHITTFLIPFLILISLGIKRGSIDVMRLPVQKQIFMSVIMAGGATSHILLEYFLVQHRFLSYFKLFVENLEKDSLYKIKGFLPAPIFIQIIIVFTLLLFIPISSLVVGLYFKLSNQFHLLKMDEYFMGLVLPAIKWGIIYSITAIIIAIFFALLFSKNMQRKVQQIILGLKFVEEGEFGKEIHMFSTDEFRDISLGYNQMTKGLLEKEFIKDTFGKYVSVEVRDKILKGHLHLGGEEKYATVLFSDIRNFTSFSEHYSPEQVVKLLNEYFTEMVAVITKNGGIVDKFIGDAIMAVFGVPVEIDEHQKKAVQTAVEMVGTLEQLNYKWLKKGFAGFKSGIGIHSGLLIAGNIGSNDRKDYTCIGDTVNLASRLEGLTKEFEIPIIISKNVRDKIVVNQENNFSIKPLSAIQIRGKEKPIEIFGIIPEHISFVNK